MVERLEMRTEDLSQEKIRMLRELFPQCITESKERERVVLSVDFDALRQELSDHVVEGPKERYQFTWPDKSKARVIANTPTTMTLRPCREESVDFDNTKNLYIEGDNLEVLKILRKTYLGKVKMIYIDPPYNTGKDWISYNDNFHMGSLDYCQLNQSFDDDGFRLEQNLRSNGRFHTNWLNSIYGVLSLAKDLLSEDGFIFISIDEREYPNLRKIMDDDIFGETNYFGDLVWESTTQPTNAGSAKYSLQKKTEMILLYAKNKNLASQFVLRNLGINYNYPHQGKHGKCRLELIEKSDAGSYNRESMKYQILGHEPRPGKRWQIGEDKARQLEKEGKIEIKDGMIYRAIYPEDEVNRDSLEPFWSLLKSTDVGTAQSGKKELNELLGFSTGFDTVKPTNLIKRLLEYVGKEGIILDFYSGTGTTAQSVIDYNHEFDANYQFILVQCPEILDEGLRQYGITTTCDLGTMRIRKASSKYNHLCARKDAGFRYYKLDSSNMTDVFYDPSSFKQMDIEEFGNNVKPDRSAEDLLIQVMLDLRIELSAKIDTEMIENTPVSIVDNGFLVACLSDQCSESVITAIAKREVKPVYAVVRNGSGMTDQMLSNIEQIFKTYSPGTEVRYI